MLRFGGPAEASCRKEVCELPVRLKFAARGIDFASVDRYNPKQAHVFALPSMDRSMIMRSIYLRQISGVLAGLVAGIWLGAGIVSHSQAAKAGNAGQANVDNTPPLVELIVPRAAYNGRLAFSGNDVTRDEKAKTTVSIGKFDFTFGNGVHLTGSRARTTLKGDKATEEVRISVRPLETAAQ